MCVTTKGDHHFRDGGLFCRLSKGPVCERLLRHLVRVGSECGGLGGTRSGGSIVSVAIIAHCQRVLSCYTNVPSYRTILDPSDRGNVSCAVGTKVVTIRRRGGANVRSCCVFTMTSRPCLGDRDIVGLVSGILRGGKGVGSIFSLHYKSAMNGPYMFRSSLVPRLLSLRNSGNNEDITGGCSYMCISVTSRHRLVSVSALSGSGRAIALWGLL